MFEKVYELIQQRFPEYTIEELKERPVGFSVTSRVNSVKQPYGGYLRAGEFEKIQLDPGTGPRLQILTFRLHKAARNLGS